MGYHSAILSTLMLYKYDNTIFDAFLVPGDMDKENVINSILIETSEMSVIYPSPDSIKLAIDIWTKKNFEVWNELYKTLHYEYNPIHNYDRTENGKDVLDGKNVETRDLTNKDEYERNLVDSGDNLNKVAAYNDGLADSSQQIGSTKYTGNSTDTKRDTGKVDNKTDNTNTHYLRAFGNIGVTSTQELIQSQRETVQFNLTDYIVNDYKEHFCVAVY